MVKARDFRFALGHDDYKSGTRWLQPFKERCGIMCKNIAGDAVFTDDEPPQEWIYKISDRILMYPDKDIYYAGETGIFFSKCSQQRPTNV